jgi:hypothetical protein
MPGIHKGLARKRLAFRLRRHVKERPPGGSASTSANEILHCKGQTSIADPSSCRRRFKELHERLLKRGMGMVEVSTLARPATPTSPTGTAVTMCWSNDEVEQCLDSVHTIVKADSGESAKRPSLFRDVLGDQPFARPAALPCVST